MGGPGCVQMHRKLTARLFQRGLRVGTISGSLMKQHEIEVDVQRKVVGNLHYIDLTLISIRFAD